MIRKTPFSEGWSLFKFNNLGLALGTNLKFYISLSKGLKLKVRKFWGLIPTFVEVAGENLVGGLFGLPSFWIGLKQLKISYTHGKIVKIYIAYELGTSSSHNNDPALKNCLFGALTLTKNADIDKYGYSDYGIGFDR